MGLFGKAKAVSSTTSAKDSIVKLRDTIDMLDKRERHLEVKIQNELKIAKANATKNKRVVVAIMALKRKKQYEDQIFKLGGAKTTLETQVNTIESANLNNQALLAMKQGASALKDLHKEMKIENVDDIMDDIRDQMDLASEIENAISQPVGIGLEMDEDELNAELEALEQEELDSKLLDVEPVPQKIPGGRQSLDLPSAPQKEPAVAKPPRPIRQQVVDDDDAELAELKASMAM